MGKSFNVELYATAYNLTNIPICTEPIDTSTYYKYKRPPHSFANIEVPAIWVYDNKNVPTIRVNMEVDYPSTGFPYNYAVIYQGSSSNNSGCYFITGYNILNENTVELYLTLDAVNTIGWSRLEGNITGWTTRRTIQATEDTLFSNALEENFTPTEPLVPEYHFIYPDPSKNLVAFPVIASTIDLENIGDIAKTYTDSVTNSSVTVPMVQANNSDEASVFGLNVNNTIEFNKKLPSTKIYVFTVTSSTGEQLDGSGLTDALSKVWSLGLTDAIAASYIIAHEGDRNVSSTYEYNVDKKIISLKNLSFDGFNQSSNIPFVWSVDNYTIKNKKVFAGQYNRYNLLSMSSGDSLEFPAFQLRNDGTQPNFMLFIDPSPNGTIYCRPTFFDGRSPSDNEVFMQAVSGSPWRPFTLVFSGSEGIYQRTAQYSFETRALNLSAIRNLGSGITGFFSNIQNPVNASLGIGNAGMAGLNLGLQRDQAKFNYQTNQMIQEPTIRFPQNQSLTDYTGNGFYVVRYRLSDNDTIRFDKFLNANGYAVNEPTTYEHFNNTNTKFNYVEASGIKINVQAPAHIVRLAEQQLSGGVYIWKSGSPNNVDIFEGGR